jgi:hypothetical protein
MATEVFINIKDLPELTEVANGDYLLIENATGTHIIDFKNFVIPSENTLLTTTVNQNISAVTQLFSDVSVMSSTLSGRVDDNTTNISTLSTRVNAFPLIYLGKSKITINSGNSEASNVLTPINEYISQLSVDDILVFPANDYASKHPVIVKEYDTSTGSVTLKGSFSKTVLISNNVSELSSLTISNLELSTAYIPAESNAIYNVFAIKTITV